MRAILFLGLFALATAKYSHPESQKDESIESNRVTNGTLNAAVCRDPDLARFINNAIAYYIHDMDGLTKNVLNQITAARKAGQWLVHAQIIASSRQGPDWQTTTNSQIFTGKDVYGCFYHDRQTYILVLRVY